jgi:methionyl-tRNA formyltransferase
MLRNTTRILFFGLYDYGMASLNSLASRGYQIIGVVTKPEQTGGRQAVAAWAREKCLPVMTPTSPRSDSFIERVRKLRPDLIVVAGYHRIIPKAILDIPPLGTINVHAGLLPAYRGPCTWKWAIMNGETTTGLTVHVMAPELDHGDILGQRSFSISHEDTGRSLFHKFCIHGAELLVETLERMECGTIEPQPQNEVLASYFSYPTERDACISWCQEARTIRNLVRGLYPSPGAWTEYAGQQIVIDAADEDTQAHSRQPGRIINWDRQRLVVGTSTHDLVIHQLHLKTSPDSNIEKTLQSLGIRLGDYFGSPVSGSGQNVGLTQTC